MSRASSRPSATAYADRVAVIVNGNAKQVTSDLVGILDQIVHSGDLFVSRSLEEGREIARVVIARGYPTVLTGGGDGTFTQMVTWIVGEAEKVGAVTPRFGLLRLGTGNAMAWVLGARGGSDARAAAITDLARLRREGGSRPIRLIEVDGMLAPFGGFGGDAVALHHYNATKEFFRRTPGLRRFASGGLAYAVSLLGRTAPEYMLQSHPAVRILNQGSPALRVGVEGQPVGQPIPKGEVIYEGPSRLVAVSTIPYWGFGARVFPFANDREDRFNLRIVDLSPLTILLNLRALWKGTYRGDTVHDFLVDDVSIEYPEPTPMQIGGDPAGSRTKVRARLADRPIQVVDFFSPPLVDPE